MWGKIMLGMAGRCSVQPEPACIPSSGKEPGEAVGEGMDPNRSCSAVPGPGASQTRGLGRGEGERAVLADETLTGRGG